MALAARGYDCSWDPPDQQCMKNSGYAFLVRYSSRDPSKNLTKAELDSALAKGLKVCVVFQEGKTQMTRGYSGGQQDARDADAFVKGLGLGGIPLYFSCDFDPASNQWGAIDAYMDGVASVIGKARTGGYGGKAFISREFGNGKITWGWQTYAWSGSPTQWDGRAQLRQVKNDFAMCGGTIDNDEAWATDYGQWPRPGQPATGTGDDVSSAVVFYKGQQFYAYINPGGKVCINGGVVDPGSNAKSGVGLAINPENGQKVITYTNTAGKLCSYHQNAGDPKWYWTDKKVDAR